MQTGDATTSPQVKTNVLRLLEGAQLPFRWYEYEVTDGVLTACRFIGGCPGNTVGVARLAVGRKLEDIISLLKGIPCRNGTSCLDQLACALESEIANKEIVA